MEQRIKTLEFLATIIAALSIIVAIVIWATMSIVEVSFMDSPGSVITIKEANPYSIALGFGVFMGGILTYFVLLVFCDMGRNMIMIRKNKGLDTTTDKLGEEQ